ncbi:MAG TPA: FAD-dependent oxidoreductase [Pirellulaceae bacterium]|nr:FAD-dependent oxidoreductase [Pirellulaceae bacterium]
MAIATRNSGATGVENSTEVETATPPPKSTTNSDRSRPTIKKLSADAVIVGAGVTGLILAMKLGRLGVKVVLLEIAAQLCSGPSTRNEGWLHNGTYHATSIDDREDAVQVARRCRYGHDQLLRFAPGAIEDIQRPAFALLKDESRAEEVMSRWDEAEVPYTPIDLQSVSRAVPNADLTAAPVAFQVWDKSIHTPMLYSQLHSECTRAGVQIITEAELTRRDGHNVIEVNGQAEAVVDARVVVYTAGYGLKSLLDDLDIAIPIRFWKSHLLVLPRLSQYGLFYLDKGEAAMMNHDKCSIVGINDDAREVDKPDFNPDPEGISAVKTSLLSLFPKASLSDCLEIGCTKIDVLDPMALNVDRSLNFAYGEPLKNHFWFVPGKMTEAPYITDVATQLLFSRIHGPDHIVAERPCDVWAREMEERI